MNQRVTLVDIGAEPLPSVTPVSEPFASWYPAPFVAPAPAVPASLTLTQQVGGVRATWAGISTAGARYELDRAPDVAGSPGTPSRVYSGTDLTFSSNETAKTHWRVRANARGRTSPWSAWVAETPINPQDVVGSGKNLVRNAAFGKRNGGLWPWVPGWNPNGAVVAYRNGRDTWTFPTYKFPAGGNLEFFQQGRTGGSPGVVDLGVDSAGAFPVKASRRYEAHVRLAAYRCQAWLFVVFYDVNGAPIPGGDFTVGGVNGIGGGELPTVGYPQVGDFFMSPANAASAVIYIRKTDTEAGQPNSVVFIAEPYFGEAGPLQTTLSAWSDGSVGSQDEIGDGGYYVRYPKDDAWQDANGVWRNGLLWNASRRQVSGGFNFPPGGFANFGATWLTGLSITFTAAAGSPATATISVSAATMRSMGSDTAYSASSGSVTGTNGAVVTYHLYYDDDAWQGGARTLGITTDITVAQNSRSRVYIGPCKVTYPTSGSGSGGGTRPPCVVDTMYLPCGRSASDIRYQDRMHLAEPDTFAERLGVVSDARRDKVPCVRFELENGVFLECSRPARIPVHGGYYREAPFLLGERVPCKRLRWRWLRFLPAPVTQRLGWLWIREYSRVTRVTDIGEQWVMRITVENSNFWASGVRWGFVLHHNIKLDPAT